MAVSLRRRAMKAANRVERRPAKRMRRKSRRRRKKMRVKKWLPFVVARVVVLLLLEGATVMPALERQHHKTKTKRIEIKKAKTREVSLAPTMRKTTATTLGAGSPKAVRVAKATAKEKRGTPRGVAMRKVLPQAKKIKATLLERL
jgi:hypothetical protein